jgi:N-acetylmuramoyl-L-alanine amidase
VSDYEALARANPTSGYSDNALWQGSQLAADVFRLHGESTDRQIARRLLQALTARFPSSSLVKQVPAATARLERPAPPKEASSAAAKSKPVGTAATGGSGTLTDIRREPLPNGVRITLALDGESAFTTGQLENPARLVVDLADTRILHSLKDSHLQFTDDIVKQIRVGRQADSRTRVVFDLTSAVRPSVYPVYNPYRLVVDLERPGTKGTPSPNRADSPAVNRVNTTARGTATPAAEAISPATPSTNGRGGFSLSRQLGLGISRIVIDPGHGGHDPGAKANGLTEAELALDVALRLEKRLLQNGVEVIMTRRTSVYIALDERTAIANRAAADLFLSIHANASENTNARGIETYFLNFAPDAAAEAIAARENAGSVRTMRNLPEIVRAIAQSDKVDESRDFATLVQERLYGGLKKVNRQARNLGVKHAPFQVLIGAAMPSILAEISFITNKQEASLLKTGKYRDHIADALLNGVLAYQKALKKGNGAVAKRE